MCVVVGKGGGGQAGGGGGVASRPPERLISSCTDVLLFITRLSRACLPSVVSPEGDQSYRKAVWDTPH